MTAGRGSPVIQLRVSEDLKAWIKEQAAQHHRSMNGEVLQVLEETRMRQQAQSTQQ